MNLIEKNELLKSRWNSSAGPRQTKTVDDKIQKLLLMPQQQIHLCGILGKHEYEIIQTTFGFRKDPIVEGSWQDQILDLYLNFAIDFQFNISRENFKTLNAKLDEILTEAESLIVVIDERITEEEEIIKDNCSKADIAENINIRNLKEAKIEKKWQPIFAKIAGAQAVIIAEYHKDNSQPQADYFSSRCVRTVAIGGRYGKRENFKQIRQSAENFLKIIKEENRISQLEEFREKYAFGLGYYISDHGWGKCGTGWLFRTYDINSTTLKSFENIEDMISEVNSFNV